MRRDLQPLRVLVEHRVDNVDERFVAVENPMPSRQQITFEPALALMLAEHRPSPVRRAREIRRSAKSPPPTAVGRFEEGFQSVGKGLVRSKNAEVPLLTVELDHIAKESPKHMDVPDAAHSRRDTSDP